MFCDFLCGVCLKNKIKSQTLFLHHLPTFTNPISLIQTKILHTQNKPKNEFFKGNLNKVFIHILPKNWSTLNEEKPLSTSHFSMALSKPESQSVTCRCLDHATFHSLCSTGWWLQLSRNATISSLSPFAFMVPPPYQGPLKIRLIQKRIFKGLFNKFLDFF